VSQPELLKLVGQRLEAAGVEYMVSGAIASSLQGELRAEARPVE
jgi:diphthamide synthase (EF-2-diphthine--ammonia ligase)